MSVELIAYAAFFLTMALTYAIMCLGLNVQWGQTGLFNVGIAGFVAIGAYTSALLTTPETADRFGGFNLPIVVGWIGAMAVTAAASAFTGYATLRLKSDYLAITTFGVAVVVHLIALNAQGLTGGPFGIAFIPRPFAALQSDAFLFNILNCTVIAIVVLVTYLALERLAHGPWGRVLKALREDERVAAHRQRGHHDHHRERRAGEAEAPVRDDEHP